MSWEKNCIMSTEGDYANNDTNTFQITKAELYVLIMTLNTRDNEELNELLRKGFKKSVYWNEYKNALESRTADANNLKRIVLDSSFEGVNRLFVLAYSGAGNSRIHMNSPRTYALP